MTISSVERSQNDHFFMLTAAILDFGRHFGKKILQKYSHSSSIIPTNFELSNFKTKQDAREAMRGDARSFFCTYKTYLYAQN